MRFVASWCEARPSQHLEVSGNRLGDGVGSIATLQYSFPNLRLGLPEIQNAHAVGILVIVGLADALDLVSLPTEVFAAHPHTAGFALAVAKVEALVDRTPIGLAACRQLPPASRLSRLRS